MVKKFLLIAGLVVTLFANQSNVLAQEMQIGKVCVSVYSDANEDGKQDTNEILVKGIDVSIFDSVNTEIASFKTADDNVSNCIIVAPGTYRVTVYIPVDYKPTTLSSWRFSVALDETAVLEFGIAALPPTAICVIAFNDANNNGMFSINEEFLKEVWVEIFDSKGRSVARFTTDGREPTCTEVEEGKHIIVAAIPLSYESTTRTKREIAVSRHSIPYIEFGAARKPSYTLIDTVVTYPTSFFIGAILLSISSIILGYFIGHWYERKRQKHR